MPSSSVRTTRQFISLRFRGLLSKNDWPVCRCCFILSRPPCAFTTCVSACSWICRRSWSSAVTRTVMRSNALASPSILMRSHQRVLRPLFYRASIPCQLSCASGFPLPEGRCFRALPCSVAPAANSAASASSHKRKPIAFSTLACACLRSLI